MRRIGKTIFILSFSLVAVVGLFACGGKAANIPSEMVGTWSDEMNYSTFPISELEFVSDGKVTLHMDGTYEGTVSGGNGKYSISIENGTGAISDVTVKEAKDAYDISVTQNSDDTLTVNVKAKGGYIYVGPESEVFYKQ